MSLTEEQGLVSGCSAEWCRGSSNVQIILGYSPKRSCWADRGGCRLCHHSYSSDVVVKLAVLVSMGNTNGVVCLHQYFVDDCNQRLEAELDSRQEELAGMRVPERVRMAVRMRLEMLIPYIGAS